MRSRTSLGGMFIPKISVVIPLYNKGPYIRRAIDSIFAQTFGNFEIIVVDGNSIDEGPRIVRSYTDTRIRLVKQIDIGVSDARNQGIMESRADYVAFLDADDKWLPTHLETIFKLIKKFPDAGLYGTSYEIQDGHDFFTISNKLVPQPPWEGKLDYFKAVMDGEYIFYTSTVCIPKKIFQKIGLFSKEHSFGEDVEMWGRIALNFPIVFSWITGAVYFKNLDNCLSNKLYPIEEHPFVQKNIKYMSCDYISKHNEKFLQEYVAFLKVNTAFRNIRAGDHKTAIKILVGCKTKRHLGKKIMYLLLSLLPHPIIKLLRSSRKLMVCI